MGFELTAGRVYLATQTFASECKPYERSKTLSPTTFLLVVAGILVGFARLHPHYRNAVRLAAGSRVGGATAGRPDNFGYAVNAVWGSGSGRVSIAGLPRTRGAHGLTCIQVAVLNLAPPRERGTGKGSARGRMVRTSSLKFKRMFTKKITETTEGRRKARDQGGREGTSG